MKKKMDIIYEDKELLVINKPHKLLTIGTETEKYRTLYHEASEYLKKQNPKNKVFIVHRLDKDTSGVVVFAKNEKTKDLLQKNWDTAAICREYTAIVEGKMPKKQDQIVEYLKETKSLEVIATGNINDKKAITNYEVVKEFGPFSLLKIKIETGRKNQIRVALSNLNHPIIGDKKYGSSKNPLGRLGLHASKLILKHPTSKKEFCWIAKTPKDFDSMIERTK